MVVESDEPGTVGGIRSDAMIATVRSGVQGRSISRRGFQRETWEMKLRVKNGATRPFAV
jgi:hypothetical protein